MNDDFASSIIHDLKTLQRHPDALSEHQLRKIIFNTIASCRCGGRLRLTPKAVACAVCRRRASVRACSVLHKCRLSFRMVVRAIWYVRMSWNPISARAFARRYRLRAATAWRLLHQVRGTIPRISMNGKTSQSQVLGRRSKRNFAVAVAGLAEEELRVDVADAAVPGGHAEPQTAFVFGHLRAWLVATFCGVTARYLDNYLAEWSHRRAQGPHAAAA